MDQLLVYLTKPSSVQPVLVAWMASNGSYMDSEVFLFTVLLSPENHISYTGTETIREKSFLITKMVDAEEKPLNERTSVSFRHDVMKELLKSKFNNAKGKISDQAVELVSEVAKAMVIEATARACYIANQENMTTVNLDHVESILPQMLVEGLPYQFTRYLATQREKEYLSQELQKCEIDFLRTPANTTVTLT